MTTDLITALIPRLRYLKEMGFITQQNGAITATSKRFTKRQSHRGLMGEPE